MTLNGLRTFEGSPTSYITTVATHLDSTSTPCCSLERLLDPIDLRQILEGRGKPNELNRLVREAEQSRSLALTLARLDTSPYPIAATTLGRFYSIINYLDDILPQRPRRIGEVGAGVAPYASILGPTHWTDFFLSKLKSDRNVSHLLGTPEPFEMASLAREGGKVELYEWDNRLLEALNANLRQGLLISPYQAVSLRNILVRNGEHPAQARLLAEAWGNYVDTLRDNLSEGCEDFTIGGVGHVASLLKMKGEVSERIVAHHADITTAKIEGEFDLFWGTNVFPYVPTKLWLASLTKAADALAVGGLLVTDNFDEDTRYALPALFGAFLHHAGFEVALSQKPPFQNNAPSVVVARKTRRTEWVDNKMALLRDIGIA